MTSLWLTSSSLLLVAAAALHGAICGLITVRSKRGPIAGGILGLVLVFVLYLAFMVFFTLLAVLRMWQEDSPNLSLFAPLTLVVVLIFYGVIYPIMLAIPGFVHGVLIGLLTNRIIERSRLGAHY